MKQFSFTDPRTGFSATMTVTENADGSLSVTIDVDESTGVTGDIRALYLNNADDQFLSGLTVTPSETDGDASSTSDTTDIEFRQDINKVRHVGSRDTNVNGEVVKANGGGFDTGLEFGTPGMSRDDVQHMEFTLSADEPLTIDSFDWTSIGLRVTSVGDVGGGRGDSLKLSGEDVTPEPVSTVVAEDDQYSFYLFDMNLDENTNTWSYVFPDQSQADLLSNDSDPDGDAFGISRVETDITGDGPPETPDANGNFGEVPTTNVGRVIVNENGSFEFLLTTDEFDTIEQDGGITPELTFTTFDYEIVDDSAGAATDTAEVTIFIELIDID